MLKKKNKEIRQYQLICDKNPKSLVAESYRTIRTNLNFAEGDQICRSIMVSSVAPLDGKSTTISNLAVVMAQAGKKVLLVDADLRKPMQHMIFQVSNQKGLTNFLLQQVPVEELTHEGLVDNLSLLTSGPIPLNPAEIIDSERCRSLWPALLKKYDYIFIDAPPVLAVTDAVIISTQVDGVILVVSSASTRIEMAKEAKEKFRSANARILGVVVNKVKMNEKEYGYYYR